MIEDTYFYTREGHAGVRQVKTRGMIAALFQHSTSRAGDPDLHTHCAIGNKVQTLEGTWHAIDGRDIYRGIVAASAYYNLRIETLLTQQLGVQFTEVSHEGKRPVREIDGISQVLVDSFSSRRMSVKHAQALLAEEFLANHGRVPTPIESAKLAQTATLATRPRKVFHGLPSEQLAAWKEHATQLLGEDCEAMCAELLHKPATVSEPAPTWGDLAGIVLRRVTDSRAYFGRNNLDAEATRVVAEYGVPADDVLMARDFVIEECIGRSIKVTADMLAQAPERFIHYGLSEWQQRNGIRYTTQAVLDAEQSVIDAVGHHDRWAVDDEIVNATIAAAARDGLKPTASQIELVRGLATSGARVQQALAPAGTGKTFAMRLFGDAWSAAGGNLIGLSHQATAAKELAKAIGENSPCDTLASLTYYLRGLYPMKEPEWASTVGPHTVIVLDEAGMAATADLAALVAWADSKGASIRFIGDDRQLAAVGSGGVLRDIDRTYGSLTLRELMRFESAAEGQATLGIRNGDHDALGFYLDNHRIHVASDLTVVKQLFAGWRADTAAGLTSLMLAPMLDQVSELNTLARQFRIETGHVDPEAGFVELHDGNLASPGDIIQTRANERKLRFARSDFVKNRDRWIVERINSNGSLTVHHETLAQRTVLPASYVSEYVELGYASTIAGCQGMSVDTSHTLFSEALDRTTLYVAISRGAKANHIYGVVGGSSDPDDVIFDLPDRLQTVTEMLEGVLDNDSRAVSATTAMLEETNPFAQLGSHVGIYFDAFTQAVLDAVGPEVVEELARTVDAGLAAFGENPASTCPAWPALAMRLAIIQAGGGDIAARLEASLTKRLLVRDDGNPAVDSAAVLCWRFGDPWGPGPLPWLPGRLNGITFDEEWATFLTTYSDAIRIEAKGIADQAHTWAKDTCPRWASPLIRNHPSLVADLAVWRAANRVQENDLTPLGSGEFLVWSVGSRNHRDKLQDRLDAATGVEQWKNFVDERIRQDPLWPVIAARLTNVIVGNPRLTEQIQSALRDNPALELPDDHPASALWYRILPLISEYETQFPTRSTIRLHPYWTDQLLAWVPDHLHDMVLSSPSWLRLILAAQHADTDHFASALNAALGLVTPREGQVDLDDWLAHVTHTVQQILDEDARLETANTPEPPPENDTYISPDDYAWHAEQQKQRASTRSRRSEPAPENDTYISPEDYAWLADQQGQDPVTSARRAETQSDTATVPTPHVTHDSKRAAPRPNKPTYVVRRTDPDTVLNWVHDQVAATGRTEAIQGNKFMACCPAHADKSPSMSVTALDKRVVLHCFSGCDEDAILAALGITRQDLFYETREYQTAKPGSGTTETRLQAPQHAARPLGAVVDPDMHVETDMPLPVVPQTSVKRVLALTEQAATWFSAHYPGSPAATHMQRRFGTDLAGDTRFRIGYAPSGWDHLTRHLVASGATPDELIDAGLSQYTKHGTLIDAFRNRVIIPIMDEEAHIIGFSGRALGDDPRKYVNTKTTPAFTKGASMFGSHLLTGWTTPVLVEGPMDAIAVTLAGDGQAVGVAPGGTSLTAKQAFMLAGATGMNGILVVATDNDDAGWNAAAKDFDLLAPFNMTLKRLRIEGKDPAEMLATNPDGLSAQLLDPESLPPLATELVTRWSAAAHATHGETLPDTVETDLAVKAGHVLANTDNGSRDQTATAIRALLGDTVMPRVETAEEITRIDMDNPTGAEATRRERLDAVEYESGFDWTGIGRPPESIINPPTVDSTPMTPEPEWMPTPFGTPIPDPFEDPYDGYFDL
jgi:DNA primase catalytic core